MIRTGTVLDQIVERTRSDLRVRRASIPESKLLGCLQELPPPRPFAPALRGERVRLIAELKRGSPSRGLFAPNADARTIAQEYLAGGAAALSVLTDEPFFGGSLDDLERVVAAAHAAQPARPVLRKDFIIDPYQVIEARAYGADAVLLIAAALTQEQLANLLKTARALGMEGLVEVHDEVELERALSVDAAVIGINSRDLRTFQVDLAVCERLAALVPEDRIVVAESGIRSVEDVRRVAEAGVDAILVGESLMMSSERSELLATLTSVEVQRCRGW